MTFFLVKQTPVLHAETYNQIKIGSKMAIDVISPKVLKLTYTAHDMQPYAKDLGYEGEPFRWDAEERFRLRCELDAIYAHLYGLTREEFDYILETFPIVRRKDNEKYGTYRTKETCLRYYDEYAGKITKKSRSHEPVHSS